MYKLYFSPPRTPISKALFPVLLGALLILNLSTIEKLISSRDDLNYPNKYCGSLVSYGLDMNKIRGFATWRVTLQRQDGDRRVFKVGDDYVHSKINGYEMMPGTKICISYITRVTSIDYPFITQISIKGDELLEKNDVVNAYLKPVYWLDYLILLSTFPNLLIYFIGIKRE